MPPPNLDLANQTLLRYAGTPPTSPAPVTDYIPVPWNEYVYWWDHRTQTDILADISGDPDRYVEDPHDNLNPF